MRTLSPILSTTTAATLVMAAVTSAFAVAPLDRQFEGVDVDNKLGQMVARDVPFTSPSAATTSLGDFLDLGGLTGQAATDELEERAKEARNGLGARPVLLTLNFYSCASLCNQQLNQLMESLVQLGWAPGPDQFRIVTVSFDPSDTVEIARGKQETYRMELARARAIKAGEGELSDAELAERAKSIDWTFLVGDERSIRTLTKNVGYYFRYDEPTRQYAHSPVIYVLSPTGVITRYLWGLELPPLDIKLGLMEASSGVLGSFGDKILGSCFVFEDGRYAFAWGVMRIGGSLVALVLGAWLFFWWRREKKRRPTSNPTLPTGPRGGPGAAAISGQGV